jgi:hypothetical protein
MSAVDSDVYSWLLMNSDLFPSSQSHQVGLPGGLDDDDSKLLDTVMKEESPVPPNALKKGKTGGRSDSLEGLTAEEKRLRRLEKNREIARNCRKRKREKIGKMEQDMKNLQEETAALKAEVARLKEQNKAALGAVQGGDHSFSSNPINVKVLSTLERKKSIREIRELIGKGDEAALTKQLSDYRDTFSDYGQQRKVAILNLLADLKKLLLPTEMTKMCMWSLQQDDEFYDEEKNHQYFGGSIWTVLCETMKFTTEQKKRLIGMRHSIRGQRKNLSHCINILEQLQSAVSNNMVALESNMTTVLNSITPEQQAKFLLWVESNQTCMLMLNNLWGQLGNQNGTNVSPTNGAGPSARSPNKRAKKQ